MNNDKWLLPEGIEEFLPEEANTLEALRRRLLSLFSSWGYDLVIPPMVEYIDSLLTGAGNDLDLQTFKLIDQASGRTLGIRADITPQVARIDSHQLSHDHPNRLCYIGSVLHTRSRDFLHSRSIKQIGAELYGHAGDDSDIEVIGLMLASIDLLGVSQIHLDMGHVEIYRCLVAEAGLSTADEQRYFDALQRKSTPEIKQLLSEFALNEPYHSTLLTLVDLHGGVGVLAQARELLKNSPAKILQAIDSLDNISKYVGLRWPQVKVHIDLGELRGYNYHTGVVFTAYTPDHIQAIAQGGRYDNIGEAFGRARPATGFSADLRTFIKLDANGSKTRPAIFAPNQIDKKLQFKIDSLRQTGDRVICALSDQQGTARELGCDRILEKSPSGDWTVVSL